MLHQFTYLRKFFLLFLPLIVALAACKKDKKENNDCSLSEANLAGSYKVTAAKYKLSSSTPEVDFFSVFPRDECEKDDVTTFNADHTVTYTDAGTVCSPANNDTGTWSLSGTTLTIDGEAGTLEGFSCAGFNATASNVSTPGDKVTVTYTKQ